MINQLTQNEIFAVNTLALEMQREAQQGNSLEKSLIAALNKRLDGFNCEAEVKGMLTGIEKFENVYAQAQTSGAKEAVAQVLTDSLQGKSPREQSEILIGLLNTNFATGNVIEEAKETAVLRIESGEEITDEHVKALLDAVSEYITESAPTAMSSKAAAELIQSLGASTLSKINDVMWNKNASPYLACAMYILRAKGELSSLPLEMSAEEIGVGVAANVAADNEIRSGAAGKKTFETVKKALQIIATAAVAALASVIIARLSFAVGGFAFLVIQAIIGFGIIGTIVAASLVAFGGFAVFDRLREPLEALFEKVHDFAGMTAEKIMEYYTNISDWIKETLSPNANKVRVFLIEKLKDIVGKIVDFVKKSTGDGSGNAALIEDEDEEDSVYIPTLA